MKKNVIVMGDLLEDIQMVRKQEHGVVLKIGFLNDYSIASQEMINEFLNSFDIVITDDGSL